MAIITKQKQGSDGVCYLFSITPQLTCTNWCERACDAVSIPDPVAEAFLAMLERQLAVHGDAPRLGLAPDVRREGRPDIDWRPISDAPRDGRRLLLFNPRQADGDLCCTGRWGEWRAGGEAAHLWVMDSGEGWTGATHYAELDPPVR